MNEELSSNPKSGGQSNVASSIYLNSSTGELIIVPFLSLPGLLPPQGLETLNSVQWSSADPALLNVLFLPCPASRLNFFMTHSPWAAFSSVFFILFCSLCFLFNYIPFLALTFCLFYTHLNPSSQSLSTFSSFLCLTVVVSSLSTKSLCFTIALLPIVSQSSNCN